MNDDYQELNVIVDEVNQEFNRKIETLHERDSFNAHTQGYANNIRKRITDLESYIDEVKSMSLTRPDIVINFKKRASEIWEEINNLT